MVWIYIDGASNRIEHSHVRCVNKDGSGGSDAGTALGASLNERHVTRGTIGTRGYLNKI